MDKNQRPNEWRSAFYISLVGLIIVLIVHVLLKQPIEELTIVLGVVTFVLYLKFLFDKKWYLL